MNETSEPAGAGLMAQVKHVFQSHFGLDDDQAKHDVIDERIRSGIHLRGTNLWVLMFAILVASIGLNVNSTAVIIGAMGAGGWSSGGLLRYRAAAHSGRRGGEIVRPVR
jgi:hypothetical protein